MGEFLSSSNLKKELIRLFKEAEKEITIISPFIQLSNEIKNILGSKQKIKNFKITILYGKNEKKPEKSLIATDFIFFKGFPNLEIYYNPNLHAKYYANENESIISSLNLHQFSLKNNIEVGILLKKPAISFLSLNQEDANAYNYFNYIINNSEPVRVSEYSKNAKSFKVLEDNSALYFKHLKVLSAYCIRTRERIPFNIKMPFSKSSYEEWNTFKNVNYKENFCHFSGEKSFGQTSFSKPILAKHWKKANLNS